VPDAVDIVVAPTFVHLDMVKRELKGPFQLGAQDCWVGKGGAFTGEVSAEMLHDFGIPWVILGHSGGCCVISLCTCLQHLVACSAAVWWSSVVPAALP
jgi:hypothetical protein